MVPWMSLKHMRLKHRVSGHMRLMLLLDSQFVPTIIPSCWRTLEGVQDSGRHCRMQYGFRITCLMHLALQARLHVLLMLNVMRVDYNNEVFFTTPCRQVYEVGLCSCLVSQETSSAGHTLDVSPCTFIMICLLAGFH
jgi:hypothetical protein